MRLDQTCIDCLLSRVRYECRLSGADSVVTERTVGACTDLIGKLRGSPMSHPQIASAVHREAYRVLGNPDPFAGLKEESNREALAVCREVRPALVTFRDHALASIIANTFD
ncbi:MAG: ARMT1-like domain-containing protein, partial [Methanoregulaceae archaeon]|nr:ARMT1-like domain-containing protein [Methanoregulaceae archaeon]